MPIDYRPEYTVEGFVLELEEHDSEKVPRSWEYIGDTFSLTIAEFVRNDGEHGFDAIFAMSGHPHLNSIHATPQRAARELSNHMEFADTYFGEH